MTHECAHRAIGSNLAAVLKRARLRKALKSAQTPPKRFSKLFKKELWRVSDSIFT